MALELIQLDIKNQLAHTELQAYNDTGKFVFEHPLTINHQYKKTQEAELLKLKKEDPSSFMNEVTNVINNIRRIKSLIKKKRYKDEAEHQSWLNNLEKAKIKHNVMMQII